MTAKPKGRVAWSELLRDDHDRDALIDAVVHEIARVDGVQAAHLHRLHAALTGDRGRAAWARLIHSDDDRRALFRAVIREIAPLSLTAQRDARTQIRLDRLRGLLDRLTV